MRRLALSRKPAEPKTAMTRPLSPCPSSLLDKHFPGRLQCNLQRIRCMREINNRSEILPHINAFHAARDPFSDGNALRSNLGFDSQAIDRGSQRGETIRDVIRPHQFAGNSDTESLCSLP